MIENENEKRETVDYVLAEMLERADAMQTHGTTHGIRLAIREFARRIKAAWKWERAKVEADALAVGGIVEATRHKPVGNATMRKAILAIKDINDRRPHDADGYEINDIINDMLSELEPTAGKSSAFGNTEEMRVALLRCEALSSMPEIRDQEYVREMRNIIAAALAAPPRNCDVGTSEEQTHRMLLYCKSHGMDESRCFRCEGCPILTADICELTWAQMPYEAEEGGEE